MSIWSNKRQHLTKPDWVTVLGLLGTIGLALAVRIPQPLHHPNIGEIDVYFWALRTQEFLLSGWSHIGTSLWVTPVVMAGIHTVFGGSMYQTFLWSGAIITAIGTPIGVYLLTKEITNSKSAGLFGALAIAISPTILYRSVFTVSETLAYVCIPWTLYFAVLVVRKKTIGPVIALVVSILLAMQTHDSAKLLVLPAGIALGIFFWETRRTKSSWVILGLIVSGAIALLSYDPTILAGIRFFLWPNNAGNTAFGLYPPVPLSDYQNVSSIVFTAFALAGVVYWFFGQRKNRRLLIPLVAFILPVLYYQQIQPRIADATIVSFRLTPYLAFIAAPFIGVVVAGWLKVVHRVRFGQLFIVLIGFLLVSVQLGIADFPLSYITSMDEQRSLTKLPITRGDYLITQTGMIGMTSVATKTNEANYFGDLNSQILGAKNSAEVIERLKTFIATNPSRPTGVLISKWKLANRDPKFGWWDSLVNPDLKLKAWKASGLPIRYEDANILIVNIPAKL